ncbi:hypothetical protein [Rurimicrobium arvi]|uniref:Type I addiction module toxin, SymE family n=1 Tax=Rurimicrobium arvi TaxID=2049916 RepID=A0ABP8MV78_9BACT
MTICSKSFARKGHRYVCFPVIQLGGKWLYDQGFRSGHVIDILYQTGEIVIRISDMQRFDGLE